METIKSLTPELKEQIKAIYLDAQKSYSDYHTQQLTCSNLESVRTSVMEYSETLSTVCDFALRLNRLSGTITSALSETLKNDKRRGCLSDHGIDKCFEITKALIDIACQKEDIQKLTHYYFNKEKAIEGIDINVLEEYVRTIE